MKASMKGSISTTLKLNYLSLLLIIVSAFFILEQYNSFEKKANILVQEEVLKKLYTLDDIEFEYEQTMLKSHRTKLQNIEKLNFISTNLLKTSQEFNGDVTKLGDFTLAYTTSIAKLKILKAKIVKRHLRAKHLDAQDKVTQEIRERRVATLKFLYTIEKKVAQNDTKLFDISSKVLALLALFIFLNSLITQSTARKFYKDLALLGSVDSNTNIKDASFSDTEGILNKLKRKPVIIESKTSMKDPVTNINNAEGFFAEYANKSFSKINVATITLIEIDDAFKFHGEYTQEEGQAILRKVADIISLHVENQDIVGRTSYEQFTLVLSRKKQKDSAKVVEDIRKTISKQKMAGKVTISCGLTILDNHKSLDKSINIASEYLAKAKEKGGDSIIQS